MDFKLCMSSLFQFLTLYSFISAIKASICIHPTEFHSNIWTVSENRADCVIVVDEIGVSSDSEISELAIIFVAAFSIESKRVLLLCYLEYTKSCNFTTVPWCIWVESRETLWIDGGSITGHTAMKQAWIRTESGWFTWNVKHISHVLLKMYCKYIILLSWQHSGSVFSPVMSQQKVLILVLIPHSGNADWSFRLSVHIKVTYAVPDHTQPTDCRWNVFFILVGSK